MSFSERFELLELLREDEVQTFRARERASGRTVEVHLSADAGRLGKLESVIDHGSYEGKFYAVTIPQGLDSAGAWRVKPAEPAPAPPQQPAAEPGDFTRMFRLRQAPESVAAPASKPPESKPSSAPDAASQPGQFTRAFQRPGRAPSAAPASASEPGQPGEFTRMFQKPAPTAVPSAPEPASQPIAPESVAPSRIPAAAIVIAIVVLAAIAVFVLLRTLY